MQLKKIIFYIDHLKNADNWVAAILDMQISKCNAISGYEPNSTTHSYMSWSTTTKTVHSRDEYESEQVDEYMINQDQLIHYHPSRVAVYVFCVGVDDVSSENHTVWVCDHP
jgi:hypothetical protein